jgi:TonB-dependent receptor
MGTNLIRAMLLASAGATIAVASAPTAAYAREASYQIDIPAQPMGDALRALGKATKKNILFDGSIVRGKQSVAVRGRMSASDALAQMVSGTGLAASKNSRGLVVQGGNVDVAPTRADASASGANAVSAPSALASTVVDARTGAALKGALIEIVETGEKTSTGDLGEFRFPGKNGSANLRISYLGYPRYEQFVDLKDGRATSGILLSDGSAVGEIVVTAYQSARAQALNQERTAPNVKTIISDDLTGKFDGNTVADALRRAPGVSFTLDPVSGDGSNIMVRGLAPEFNTVTLNGVPLSSGSGLQRSPDLQGLLADSISKITLNKTLLPSQEGSGTGALVEIETKGPLDRPNRYFSFSSDYGKAARNFLEEYSLSGTASWRFGESKNFGISISAQLRKRDLASVRVSTSHQKGEYLPAGISSRFDLDPSLQFPYEPGASGIYQQIFNVGNADSSLKNSAYSAAAQWDIGGHTNLRLDYVRTSLINDEMTRRLAVRQNFGYRPLPISSLGGEIRSALVWENYTNPGLLASARHSLNITKNKYDTDALTFKGESGLGLWSLEYKAGYSKSTRKDQFFDSSFFSGTSSNNVSLSESNLTDEVLSNQINGRIVSLFPRSDRRIQLPGLNESGYDVVNNTANLRFDSAQGRQNEGKSETINSSLAIRRDFSNQILKYVEVGASYQRDRSSNDDFGNNQYFGDAPVDQLGVTFEEDSLSRAGLSSNLNILSRRSARTYYDSLISGNQPSLSFFEYPDDPNSFLDKLNEQRFALYTEISLEFGKFQAVGGVRFEKEKKRASSLYSPFIINDDGSFDQDYFDQNAGIRNYEGGNTTFLPRLALNYRFSDSTVLRLGYYRSVAPQPITALSSQSSVQLVLLPFYGPEGNQPLLAIGLSNPGLRPSSTDNLDLSFEWYFDSVGIFKAGAFYKPTKNSFMNIQQATQPGASPGIELPDDPRFQTPNLYITTTRPENDPEITKLWGLEFSIERQFNFLPGWLSGLGVYANYTYSDGSKSEVAPYALAPDGFVRLSGLRYSQQVPHSGTLALTYSKDGIAGSLSYTAQSAWSRGFPEDGFDSIADAVDTLDFKMQYNTRIAGAEARLYFEGSNLLKGSKTPTNSQGIRSRLDGSTYNTAEAYLGGRIFKAGLSLTF